MLNKLRAFLCYEFIYNFLSQLEKDTSKLADCLEKIEREM